MNESRRLSLFSPLLQMPGSPSGPARESHSATSTPTPPSPIESPFESPTAADRVVPAEATQQLRPILSVDDPHTPFARGESSSLHLAPHDRWSPELGAETQLRAMFFVTVYQHQRSDLCAWAHCVPRTSTDAIRLTHAAVSANSCTHATVCNTRQMTSKRFGEMRLEQSRTYMQGVGH